MTAPLSPQQFGPYLTPERGFSRNRISSLFGGGHSNPGYGKYDHLATEPLSVEGAARQARRRGADGKN